MRVANIIVGLGLGIVWLVGLDRGAAGWLVWLDFVAAVVSILVGVVPARRAGQFRVSDGVIGVGLIALWIIALAVGAEAWMAWWTFAFGVAYLIIAGVGSTERTHAFGRASHA